MLRSVHAGLEQIFCARLTARLLHQNIVTAFDLDQEDDTGEGAEAIARDAGCDRIEVTSTERRTRVHDFLPPPRI